MIRFVYDNEMYLFHMLPIALVSINSVKVLCVDFTSSSLERKILKDGLSVDKLLDAHTSGSEHSKTSVRQFLRLHGGELSSIGRLQSKRIETNIAGVVVFSKGEKRSHSWFDPSLVRSESFNNVDDEEEWEHYTEKGNFRDHVVSDRGVVESVGDGGGVFTDEVSNGGHHGNTSVHDFCLTDSLDTDEVSVGAESQRIEETERGDGSWKAEARLIGNRSPSIEGRSKRRRGRRLDLGGFGSNVSGLEGTGGSGSGDRGEGRNRRSGDGQD